MPKRKLTSNPPTVKCMKLTMFGFGNNSVDTHVENNASCNKDANSADSDVKVDDLNLKARQNTDIDAVNKEDAVSDAQTDTAQSATSSGTKTTPLSRTFKDSWRYNNPWLRYDPKDLKMYCSKCIRAQVCNTFTIGTGVMKKETITKHTKGTGPNSHHRALELIKQSADMDVARESIHAKNKDAITSALRNVYFAAKNDLSNNLIPKLHELCIEQGAVQLKDLKVNDSTTYTHNQSLQEFQTAIAQVLEEKLVEKVKKSEGFSVMMDESTDTSVQQNLIVYIRILERVGPRTEPKSYFLGIRQIKNANAETITNEILDVLKSKGIDVTKMVGVSTDGAAVMIGRKSGVVTRLKELVPGLLSTHCVAHRLALACSASSDKVIYLVKFQGLVNSIYKYFSMSPKHIAQLESIQGIIDSCEKSRMKQVCATRWLSFEGAVHAIVRNYSAVLSVFLEDGTAHCLSLHKPLSTYKFLYCCHFLSDVLKQLSILSKIYQKSDLDFSQVHPLLQSTIDVLESLRDGKSGTILKHFVNVVPTKPMTDEDGLETFQFEGHTIKDGERQRQEAESACTAFIDHCVSSLKDRFSEAGDAKAMTSLTSLLNPSVEVCSTDDIKIASEYLKKCGAKDIDCLEQEMVGFKAYVKVQLRKGSQGVKSVKDVCQLGCHLGDVYQTVGLLCSKLLLLPVSTVDCERGFSQQNLVKTNRRNRLNSSTLENLLRIRIDGSTIPFSYDEAFQKWASAKSRKILK